MNILNTSIEKYTFLEWNRVKEVNYHIEILPEIFNFKKITKTYISWFLLGHALFLKQFLTILANKYNLRCVQDNLEPK